MSSTNYFDIVESLNPSPRLLEIAEEAKQDLGLHAEADAARLIAQREEGAIMEQTETHPDTCLVFEKEGRTIEVDDLSRSGGMEDTYAVYENGVQLGDFMTTMLGVPVVLTLDELAWEVVKESDGE